MNGFRHYILTRFNVGLYDLDARTHAIYQPIDGWMQDRMQLFATFTLPSIMSQTCQNFTWLVLMDEKTPQHYIDTLLNLGYRNMRIVMMSGEGLDNKVIAAKVLAEVGPGDGDLITTRIDNDDAFREDVIETIQQWHAPKPDPWAVIFPNGLILDTTSKKMHVMSHWFNNCPTLIEPAQNARTVFFEEHSRMLVKVKTHIVDKLYWLQVVHNRNVVNSLEPENPSVMIDRNKIIALETLCDYGVDPKAVATNWP